MEKLDQPQNSVVSEVEQKIIKQYNLTNTEWLRYRLTGELPQRDEVIMVKPEIDKEQRRYSIEDLRKLKHGDFTAEDIIFFMQMYLKPEDWKIEYDPSISAGNLIHLLKNLNKAGVEIDFSYEIEALYKIRLACWIYPIIDLKKSIENNIKYKGSIGHTSYKLVGDERSDVPEELKEIYGKVIYFLSQYYLLANDYAYASQMFEWLDMKEESGGAIAKAKELHRLVGDFRLAYYGEGAPTFETLHSNKEKMLKLINEIENAVENSELKDFKLETFAQPIIERIKTKLPEIPPGEATS